MHRWYTVNQWFDLIRWIALERMHRCLFRYGKQRERIYLKMNEFSENRIGYEHLMNKRANYTL